MLWVILTIATRWRFKMLFGFQHLPSSQILGSVKNFTGPIKSSLALSLRRLSPPFAFSLPLQSPFYGRGLRGLAMDQTVIQLMTGHYLKSVSLIPNAATASLNLNEAFPPAPRYFESCSATLTRVSVTSLKQRKMLLGLLSRPSQCWRLIGCSQSPSLKVFRVKIKLLIRFQCLQRDQRHFG